MYYYRNTTRRVLTVKGVTFKPGQVSESPEYIGFPGLISVPKPASPVLVKGKVAKVDKPNSNETADAKKGGKPNGSNSNK